MSTGFKLSLLLGINLLALVILVVQRIKKGDSYTSALQYAWERVICNSNSFTITNFNNVDGWHQVLHKSWWLVILFMLGLWLIEDRKELNSLLIFLVIFHLAWFLQVKIGKKHFNNCIVSLNSNWGIILQEVTKESILKNRSLAELDLRKKNLLVLAIERNGHILTFPKGVETLNDGDKLVIFGDLNYYRGMVE